MGLWARLALGQERRAHRAVLSPLIKGINKLTSCMRYKSPPLQALQSKAREARKARPRSERAMVGEERSAGTPATDVDCVKQG